MQISKQHGFELHCTPSATKHHPWKCKSGQKWCSDSWLLHYCGQCRGPLLWHSQSTAVIETQPHICECAWGG